MPHRPALEKKLLPRAYEPAEDQFTDVGDPHPLEYRLQQA